MKIYLYVKTHNKTGLKYLGSTKNPNPHRYPGSGKYWIRHLKKHGYDFTTEILKECDDYASIRTWGLHYSELWQVDLSDEWANLMLESGPGREGYELNKHRRKLHNRQKIERLIAVADRELIRNLADPSFRDKPILELLVQAQILIPKNGRIMLNAHWELFAQIHRDVWAQFRDQYDWCDGGVREQIYCLLNNIDEPTGCKHCTGFVTFNHHKHRYNNYCSRQCIHSTGGGVNNSVASTALT